MQRYRPNSVLVIARLHLVFGGLGLLCSFWGAISSGAFPAFTSGGRQAQQAPDQQVQQIERELERRIPYYKEKKYVTWGIDLLLSILMLISGVGLLQMQSWARVLSVIYALLSIIMKVFSVSYAYLVEIPAGKDLLPKGNSIVTGETIVNFILLMQLVYMIYPIVVLCILCSSSVSAAFRGENDMPGPPKEDFRYWPPGRSDPDDRFRP